MKNFVNVYIFLFLLYYLQGTLYVPGSLLGRLLLVIVMIMSFYYWIYAMTRMQLPKSLKILSFLMVIWTLYGIYPVIFGVGHLAFSIPSFYVLKGQYMSLLPIFTFYVFSKKEWLTEKMVQKWTFVFLVVAIASFYAYYNRELQAAIERGSQREEFTNNAGYVVLSILPLLPLFWRKPILQYGLLSVCMWYVLIGFKRGAILAGALCSLWLLHHSLNKNKAQGGKHLRQQVIRALLIVVLIIGASYAIQMVMSSSDYFNTRLEDTLAGNSSGRDSLYSFFWKYFIEESNPFVFLFGNGAFGTLKIFSNFAHNDWLEIAIDNGLVLLLVYAAYWISLFVMIYKSMPDAIATQMLTMFVIIYFLKSIFSMSYNDISPYAACAFGFALANYESRYSRQSQEQNTPRV